jgi:hypothetical protein
VLKLNTKLILVEGIPGSGKTTTANYIKNYLDQKNISNKLFKEGDLTHPADYESVACLNKEKYKKILSQLKIDKDLFENYIIKKDEDYLLEYRKLYNNPEINLDSKIYSKIANNDIYNLKLEKYSSLVKDKWYDFAQKAKFNRQIYIFECCFLQNPLTTMLAYHNASEDYIINYIKELEAAVSKLNPLLILLEPKNIEEQFSRVKKERPEEWLNFVINYVTNQDYGHKNNLTGYQGLIEFYQYLAELELNIFSKLNINKILIKDPHSNWDQNYQNINAFLKKAAGGQ